MILPRSLPALLLLLALLAPALARAEGLSIQDAVRQALERNERARIAALRVDVAQASLDRARAAFFPSLTFAAGITANPNPARGRSWRSSSGTLSFSMPLVQPTLFPQRDQAAHTLEAERFAALEQQRVLAFDTARAFNQTLAAERVLRAAQSRLDRAKANFDNADARSKAQLTSTNDATRARVEVASAAREVANGQSSVRRARLQLGFLLGREIAEPLEPPDHVSQAAQGFQADPAQLARAASDQRFDLRSLRQQIRASQASAREPLYRLAPTLSVGAQLRLNPEPLPTERWNDESLSLTLSWTIFDGGIRYADRRSRLAQAESLTQQEQLQRRSISNDIQAAMALLDAARQALLAAEEGITAAQANTDETLILYRQGLARAIELTTANASRFDAEVNLAAARLSLVDAYLEVRFAQGLFPFDPPPKTTVRPADEGASP